MPQPTKPRIVRQPRPIRIDFSISLIHGSAELVGTALAGNGKNAVYSVFLTGPRPALMLLRAFLLSTRRAFAALLGLVLIRRSGRTSAASTNSFSRARASALFASWVRSEEHTSELQSLMRTSYAVFCL